MHVVHSNMACRDGVHRWDRCILPSDVRLQQRIIDDMENFMHMTDAKRNSLLYTFLVDLEAGASVLVKNSERSSSSPSVPTSTC